MRRTQLVQGVIAGAFAFDQSANLDLFGAFETGLGVDVFGRRDVQVQIRGQTKLNVGLQLQVGHAVVFDQLDRSAAIVQTVLARILGAKLIRSQYGAGLQDLIGQAAGLIVLDVASDRGLDVVKQTGLGGQCDPRR